MKTYYVTRYGMSQIDGGTRRSYLTVSGEWTPDRERAEGFATRPPAETTARRFPGAVAEGFTEYH